MPDAVNLDDIPCAPGPMQRIRKYIRHGIGDGVEPRVLAGRNRQQDCFGSADKIAQLGELPVANEVFSQAESGGCVTGFRSSGKRVVAALRQVGVNYHFREIRPPNRAGRKPVLSLWATHVVANSERRTTVNHPLGRLGGILPGAEVSWGRGRDWKTSVCNGTPPRPGRTRTYNQTVMSGRL